MRSWLTVTFIVEVPFPEIEDGLKLMDVPLPCPDAESEIVEMLPWVTVVVIVEVPEDPLATLRDVGFAEMVKIGVAAVTVRFTIVVSTVPSEPVPVTVTTNAPVGAVGVAVNVSTELPDAVIGFLL